MGENNATLILDGVGEIVVKYDPKNHFPIEMGKTIFPKLLKLI